MSFLFIRQDCPPFQRTSIDKSLILKRPGLGSINTEVDLMRRWFDFELDES